MRGSAVTTQPWRNTWRRDRLPGTIRTTGTKPVAIPPIVEAIAVEQLGPFNHIDTQAVVPMRLSVRRRGIAWVATLNARRARRLRRRHGRRRDHRPARRRRGPRRRLARLNRRLLTPIRRPGASTKKQRNADYTGQSGNSDDSGFPVVHARSPCISRIYCPSGLSITRLTPGASAAGSSTSL